MKTALPLALLMLLAAPAAAEICAPSPTQSALQHQRRLSLDLRGKLPTVDEMRSVIEAGSVKAETVDAWLDSADFSHQLRAYHRDLLWSNIARQRLTNNAFVLRPPRGGVGPWFIPAQVRQVAYRGGRVPCLNEPASWDEDGNLVTVESPDPQNDARTVQREGYVEVEPYWAPGESIRVCAFDAQTAIEAENPRNGQPIPCVRGQNAPGCGCGENLRNCVTADTQRAITNAMAEQTLETMARIVAEDRPYTEVVLGQETVVNGPLVHYFNHLTSAGGNFIAASPDPGYPLPEATFDDESWRPVPTIGQHAGILTLPGFMMRFQSDRGRANRFYEAFLCQSFQAPAGGLPAADDPCQQEPDLVERCGCGYCHQTLEPAASHWGRWTEAGVAHMDERAFPRTNPLCATPRGANNQLCRRFYVTEPNHPKEEAYHGQLRSYLFADAHPGRAEIIEAGPRRLAEQAVAGGQFATCTTTKMWSWFMGRAPRADEAATIQELASTFAADGYRLKGLVRAVISRPEYVASGEFTGKEVQ